MVHKAGKQTRVLAIVVFILSAIAASILSFVGFITLNSYGLICWVCMPVVMLGGYMSMVVLEAIADAAENSEKILKILTQKPDERLRMQVASSVTTAPVDPRMEAYRNGTGSR